MAQFRPVSDAIFVPSEELGEDAKYWKNLEVIAVVFGFYKATSRDRQRLPNLKY